MPAATDGLAWVPEARLLTMLGISRSTYRSWAEEGLVDRPATGAYTETQVVEAILAEELRRHLPVPTTLNAMRELRATGELARFVDLVRPLDRTRAIDLLVDADMGDAKVCAEDQDVVAFMRAGSLARRVVIVPLAERLFRSVQGFRNHAEYGPPPEQRRRGRRRANPAGGGPTTVTSIRGGAS